MHNGAGAIKVLRILVALALVASVVSLTVAAGVPANVAGSPSPTAAGNARADRRNVRAAICAATSSLRASRSKRASL